MRNKMLLYSYLGSQRAPFSGKFVLYISLEEN